MKNYCVKIDMGYKTAEIYIRGHSQADAEKYVSENLNTEEFNNVNPHFRSKVIFTK